MRQLLAGQRQHKMAAGFNQLAVWLALSITTATFGRLKIPPRMAQAAAMAYCAGRRALLIRVAGHG